MVSVQGLLQNCHPGRGNYYLEPEQTWHGTGYVPRVLYLYIGIAHNVCVFRDLMGNDGW